MSHVVAITNDGKLLGLRNDLQSIVDDFKNDKLPETARCHVPLDLKNYEVFIPFDQLPEKQSVGVNAFGFHRRLDGKFLLPTGNFESFKIVDGKRVEMESATGATFIELDKECIGLLLFAFEMPYYEVKDILGI